jgi:hypothetical protein
MLDASQHWRHFTIGYYPVWERVYTDHSWENAPGGSPAHVYKWASEADIDKMIEDAGKEEANVRKFYMTTLAKLKPT